MGVSQGGDRANISERRFGWRRNPEEGQIHLILMAIVPIGSFVFIFLL